MMLQQAQKLLEQGLTHGARDLARKLVQLQPNQFEPQYLLAVIEQRSGNIPQAILRLEQCLKIKPNDTRAILALAHALDFVGRSDEAIALCERGLSIKPGEPAFILQKATTLDQCNRYDEAWETLQPLLDGRPISAEAAGVITRVLTGLGRHDEAIRWAETTVKDQRNTPVARRTLWLYLVKVYDKVGRYDDAMAACVAAHETVQVKFDPAEFRRYNDSIIAAFSGSSLRMLARAENDSELPVFVIGMPRSGTTLVEQIIAAHPMAYGAGEIQDIENLARSITTEAASMYAYPDSVADMTPEIATRMANAYLTRLQELGGDAARVTNKMLQQYEYVGFIWMLLPKARIIHIRRNPLDTCLSCYTRHLNPTRMPYAVNLEHLGLAYREHERLMDHWKATLDLPILTVQYEELVADQERISRQIIDFVGLPWDDRCLRYYEADRVVTTLSYDQVNKPIYDSSIGRWKHYEKYLGPLRKALGEVEA